MPMISTARGDSLQTTATPPPSDIITSTPVPTMDSGERGVVGGKSNETIVAILGAMSAILLLTLVGVVMRWAWFHHRNKSTEVQR